MKKPDSLWLAVLAVSVFSSIRILQPEQGYRRTFALAIDPSLTVQEPCVIPPGRTFQAIYYGMLYTGNTANLLDQRVLCFGAWEKHILNFLDGTSRKLDDLELVFVDVGANSGLHTLFMAKRASRVHAFDPYPPVLEQLHTNITINNLANVTAHEVGLGAESARLPFFEPREDNQGTGSFVFDNQTSRNRDTGIELEIVAGDRYFAEHGISRVDLLKIDVEGYEKSVLEGLRRTIQDQRPIVVMEITIRAGREHLFAKPDDFAAVFPDNYRFFSFRSWNAWTGSYELGRLEVDFAAANYQCDLVAAPVEKLDRLAASNPGTWQ